jgi:thiol-disulfide isomerase/thioredoxin
VSSRADERYHDSLVFALGGEADDDAGPRYRGMSLTTTTPHTSAMPVPAPLLFHTPVLTLLLSSQLVVVDFTATWCGPCQRIAPEFAKMAEEHKDCIFIKVDVDENEVNPHPACLLLFGCLMNRVHTRNVRTLRAMIIARLLFGISTRNFISSGACLGRGWPLGFSGLGS